MFEYPILYVSLVVLVIVGVCVCDVDLMFLFFSTLPINCTQQLLPTVKRLHTQFNFNTLGNVRNNGVPPIR